MNNNISDKDSIIIECKKCVWAYVTDKNWDKTRDLILLNNYKNVSFFGPVTSIKIEWLPFCLSLENMDFIVMNSLKNAGGLIVKI